jgi:hypothetical protein
LLRAFLFLFPQSLAMVAPLFGRETHDRGAVVPFCLSRSSFFARGVTVAAKFHVMKQRDTPISRGADGFLFF